MSLLSFNHLTHRFKPILVAGLLVCLLGACGRDPIAARAYHVVVQQGNIVEKDKVDQLRRGHTQEQVLYLLGTPLLDDPFSQDTWTYRQFIYVGDDQPLSRLLILHFSPDDQKLLRWSWDTQGSVDDVDATVL